AAVIDALAPNTPEYAALRRGYQTYRAIAKAGGWPRVDAASPGERLRQLQQRLSAEGYLPAGYATGVDDDQTIAALRAFQEHHGIEPDGRLGRATLAEINVSADARTQQIAVGLERMRWLTRDMPATRIWVNTAIQRLQFYQNGQVAFTTRVVVGQIDKQTPEFATTINSLLYNPPWNVPYSIASKEILPKLDEDPDYLEKHNMVMRDNGSITQLPGAGTALGRLKFEMQDNFDVYLHDTPQRYLFSRTYRRLSHGCVRVQNPRDLATLISGIPIEDINRGIARGTTTRHMLPAAIPVYIVYQTAYIGDDGQVVFAHDYYRRDDAVWRHLVPTTQLPVAGRDYDNQRHG
ncbi:MAG: L,D-transpeptidase family protein, partial [Stellaceae bacterium]